MKSGTGTCRFLCAIISVRNLGFTEPNHWKTLDGRLHVLTIEVEVFVGGEHGVAVADEFLNDV